MKDYENEVYKIKFNHSDSFAYLLPIDLTTIFSSSSFKQQLLITENLLCKEGVFFGILSNFG